METTRAILGSLIQTLGDAYAEQLQKLPMKKTTREILIDGYRAGVQSGVMHAVQMLEIKVHE